MISKTVSELKTIKDVVKLINDGGTKQLSASKIAAEYAYHKTGDIEDRTIFFCRVSRHLNQLLEHDAKFNYIRAVQHINVLFHLKNKG